MDSHLPFFMFWLVKQFKTFIGMDYERGLQMFKEYIESDTVSSKVNIKGQQKLKEQRYVGIPNQSSIDNMEEVMPKDFEILYNFLKDKNVPMDRNPFAIYETFDIYKKHTRFITAYPIMEDVEVSSPFIKGKVELQNVINVTHTGAYHHLANAWSTAMAYSRFKKLKIKKQPVGFEFYLNDPDTTPNEDLITDVMVPLR